MVRKIDYNEKAVRAAKMVLTELYRILGEYAECLYVVGGWVPLLTIPQDHTPHVGSTDVDLALIYGIGFPPFRGGALHYIDDVGIDKFVARADELAAAAGPLKAMYLPTEKLREMAANGDTFFGTAASGRK